MKDRDMFYQNLNQGYSNPGNFVPPSGYNLNTQYQAYGPNVIPEQMNQNYNSYNNYNDEYEQRFSRIERQIKNLDTRLQKIENLNSEQSDNIYMI